MDVPELTANPGLHGTELPFARQETYLRTFQEFARQKAYLRPILEFERQVNALRVFAPRGATVLDFHCQAQQFFAGQQMMSLVKNITRQVNDALNPLSVTIRTIQEETMRLQRLWNDLAQVSVFKLQIFEEAARRQTELIFQQFKVFQPALTARRLTINGLGLRELHRFLLDKSWALPVGVGYQLDEALEILAEALEGCGSLRNSTKKVTGTTSVLNRHAVLHGESVDYDTEQNSLKCVSWLALLGSVGARKN